MGRYGDSLKKDKRLTLDEMECVLENEQRRYSDPDRTREEKPRSLKALQVYALLQELKNNDPDPLF